MDANGIVFELYKKELGHCSTFRALAYGERNPEIKRLMLQLADEEWKHAKEWFDVLGRKRDIYKDRGETRAMRSILALRRIIGLELAIKFMEHSEKLLEQRLAPYASPAVRKVLGSEGNENRYKTMILEYSNVLGNIRDVVFGMNDGLVEILAATAGIGAAIQQPLLVLTAGLIVAISGTLSMGGGAYLATEYGSAVEKKKKADYIGGSPKTSAFYVAVSYIIGALFPLAPFVAGMSGYTAIAASVILTAIVLVFSSTIISIVSDTSATERAAKTLAITLGIAAITIIIGFYARHYLHLSI
jgi:VIT1/CCC1 family predicted Fe2+/Mn2+ transporter